MTVSVKRTVTDVRRVLYADLLLHLGVDMDDLTEVHVTADPPRVSAGELINEVGTVTVVTKYELEVQ